MDACSTRRTAKKLIGGTTVSASSGDCPRRGDRTGEVKPAQNGQKTISSNKNYKGTGEENVKTWRFDTRYGDSDHRTGARSKVMLERWQVAVLSNLGLIALRWVFTKYKRKIQKAKISEYSITGIQRSEKSDYSPTRSSTLNHAQSRGHRHFISRPSQQTSWCSKPKSKVSDFFKSTVNYYFVELAGAVLGTESKINNKWKSALAANRSQQLKLDQFLELGATATKGCRGDQQRLPARGSTGNNEWNEIKGQKQSEYEGLV